MAGASDAIARLSAVFDDAPARSRAPSAESASAPRAQAVSPVIAALAARGGAAALRLSPEPALPPAPEPALPRPAARPDPTPPAPAAFDATHARAADVVQRTPEAPPWSEARPGRSSFDGDTAADIDTRGGGDSLDVSQAASSEPARTALRAVEAPPARLLDHEDWLDLQARCGLGGPVRELAAHSVFAGYDGIRLKLSLPLRLEHLRLPATVEALAQKLGEALGEPPRIELINEELQRETLHARSNRQRDERQSAAEQSFEAHPAVRRLIDQRGLRLVPDSIRPLDD
jgi:DNA polymerase-3 subunit gamma/tau